jgi:hypothetical protein
VLITVQFPLADLRPFVATETRRLVTPDWPTPRPNLDFIRSFGRVKDRPGGGLTEFAGEHIFCDAARAIRFDTTFSIAGALGVAERYCAFRRYFSDGEGVSRIEVGVGLRGNTKPDKFLSILESTVALPVKIGRGEKAETTALLRADRPLARMILRASTRNLADFKVQSWWITPCAPAILVEYNLDRETVEIPAHFRKIAHPGTQGIELAYGGMTFADRTTGVWLFGIRNTHDRDYRRRLRLTLLRLHAQREVVQEVLRAIRADKLDVARTSPDDPPDHPSNALQQFLIDTIARMDRAEYGGVTQTELLRAAEEMQDSTLIGEREAILQRLQPLRRYVMKAVEKFIIVKGDYVDNSQHITFGDNASGTFNINQVAAETITNSFNRVEKADVSPELKTRLEELTKLVKQLQPKLSEADQQKAADSLDILTKQATSKKPDRKWYDLSAEGLMEAAKTVGDLAAPIGTALKAILPLLVF